MFVGVWGCFGRCLGRYVWGVWGCVAWICEEFWKDLGGKNGLIKLKKKRVNKNISFFYFVMFVNRY